uniref:Integrase catalytic domain-containing protein n=1 Tax=Tanacetum cinerariifolium TaxID=118510 RepID=A0A6L2KYS3_TANCI|nr:hypothetical protein [Tanacetum cinerariifolium]
METYETSERYIAPCFVNGLKAYDGEVNVEFDENLISNEFAIKLCLDYEFIINPEEDDSEPVVILGRSFLRLAHGVVDFEEAAKEALAVRISQKFALLEEERPVIETMAYNDKYKNILDEILRDKVEIDGKTVKEEEDAVKRFKGEASKEKDNPSAFILPIRLEGKVNENTLANTGLQEHMTKKPDRHDPNAQDNTKQWKRLHEARLDEEIFTSVAWIRAFNINEPIYAKLCHEFYSTYEFDERINGYDKIHKNDLWLLSMFNARHQNRYTNVAWVIAKWIKRKGAVTQKESQICYGQFISKLARKCSLLTKDVIRILTAPIYCRDLDTITLRDLIDSDGKLILEDPQPGVPTVGIPRPLRASMQDLYDRIGRIEIRQEAIEHMEYREPTTLLAMLSHSMTSTVSEEVACEDSSKWKAAMKEKMDSLRKNKTYEFVDYPAGQDLSKTEIGSTKSLLKKEFDMKELWEAKKILGIEIIKDRRRKILIVSQSQYVSNNFRIDNGKSVQMPLGGHFKLSLKDCKVRDCDVERMSKVLYANAVGSIMYLMVCTRPNIMYAVSVVRRYLANSDYAKDPDKALSTIEAEYMALTKAVKEAIWLRGLLEELGVELNTMFINCDNQDAIHLSWNHVFLRGLSTSMSRRSYSAWLPAGVWSKLETLYMKKSLANKLYLNKKLYTFYMPAGRKISEHIDEFNKSVFDLTNIVVTFKDEDLALLLLLSLPASYEHFVDTLLYGREALTLKEVMAILNSKEIKEMSKVKGDNGFNKLRTDNGLEFCNRKFKQLCIKSGIARHLTDVGMPQHNGLEECMNRTLIDNVEVELVELNNHTLKENQTDQEDGNDKDAGDQETDQAMDLTNYQLEEYTHEPLTYQEEVTCEDSSMWKASMKEEMDSLRQNKTYKFIDYLVGQKLEFDIKELREAKKILGMKIVRDQSRKIPRVLQSRYVSKILNNFRIDNGKSVQMPLGGQFKVSLKNFPVKDYDVERMSKVPYANAVGILMYLMVCTRPSIAYAGTTNVVFGYGINHGNHVDITCFVDSDYAKDPDKEAECMTLTKAVKKAIWLRGLLEELAWSLTLCQLIVISGRDSLIMKSCFFMRGLSISMWVITLSEKVLEANTVEILKVGTEYNVADALTKVVHGFKLQHLELLSVAFHASACSLSTLHFLKILKNSLEVLKVLKNSLEVLNLLKNSLEVLKVMQMELQENSSIDEVGLQRLYKSSHTAKEMIWHATGKCTESGKMQHRVDGRAWKNFDTNQAYNMWPVILTTYNLPPWLCMKESSFMLTLLIPGPKSTGKNIDVYLRPLIEDLKVLWDKKGVENIDVASVQKFNIRAMDLWTINDFLARSSLSEWSGQGYKACPTCNKDTPSIHVDPPKEFSRDEILAQLDRLPTRLTGKHPSFGGVKIKRNVLVELNWTKRSIIYELEYWSFLTLRHNLDIMHIEDNVLEAILNTLLMNDKSKYTVKARQDLQRLGIRSGLWLGQTKNEKCLKPQAAYSFTPENRKKFCHFIKGVKLPDGFGSYLKHKVTDNDTNITGQKSHDYHIMIQHLLPYGLKNYLPDKIAKPIIELCSLFKQMYYATLMEDDMGVIVVEDDPDIIHFDNSSDLPLSTSLNDLENATLHIDGQSTEVDVPPDIIDVVDEDDDITDDEDAIPHDLADSDNEDLINEITNTKGPVSIQFELRDKQTVMHLSDHAAHWSSYIGEVIRGVLLYYPSWLKVPKERKAALIIDIGTQFDLRPHMESSEWTEINAGIQQHLQNAYNTNKAAFKAQHWVIDPTIGTYDVEKIRRARPENITASEWDKYIQFWNDPRNIARAAQNQQNRAKSTVISRQGSRSLARLRDEMRQSSTTQEYPSPIDTFFVAHTVNKEFLRDEDRRIYEEMMRLEATGTYTDDEINRLARGGKQRGHIPGVGRFESGGTSGSGGCGDDEESADHQDDEDEDGDGDT